MSPKETWSINKPAVKSNAGIVTAQHHITAKIGASILNMGGNAIKKYTRQWFLTQDLIDCYNG